MNQQDIRPGDVILARGDINRWSPGREAIKAVTGSPYTHAAIALSGNEVMDARAFIGVKIRQFTELLQQADYVAVLRHPDAWTDDRVQALRDYSAALHALGAKYNYVGAAAFLTNSKVTWQAGLTEALQRYFEQGEPQAVTKYGPFFCSELVVACFVHGGFIAPSAAVLMNASFQAPGDILKEPTFGYLVGFLSKDPNFEVLNDDPLRHAAKYHDIFGP